MFYLSEARGDLGKYSILFFFYKMLRARGLSGLIILTEPKPKGSRALGTRLVS